ncbi:MAG: GDSL-type esterase/lipase family protein [Planctomycetes bacterium]|jgi:lysophospholipase L1-like esterase|nr:GDSL-type esterase/lipase family protein [Planctomycetota bacterium]
MPTMLRTFLLAGLLAAPAVAQQPKPLRVFLLAGQSNMEGHGVVDLDDARDYNGGRGTLQAFLREPANAAAWPGLRAADGTWVQRDDVFVTYRCEHGLRKVGPLSIGFGAYEGKHHIGPELGIGRALGDHFAEPVLLIKTAWGGKSLQRDFRPPGAGGEVGAFYTRMLAEYRQALAGLATDHPQLAALRPQLDGVIWFQGWNDACDDAATAEYAVNLRHLLADLRRELGAPELPFVIGETGNWDGVAFRSAQRQGCLDAAVAANTRFVATRQFLRAAEASPNTGHGHHWYGNGESYLRIGDALGRAMLGVIAARTPPAIPAGEEPLRWEQELAAIDRQPAGPARPVVFVGSSSIRGWKNLATDMAPLPVRNHGFGGSRLFDTTYWLERLVVRHDPSVIVVFAGSNDIAGAEPRPAAWVAARFDELVQRLRALGSAAPLVYIAITPTPSRAAHLAIVREANRLIAARCAQDPSLHFVDTAAGMVTAAGEPDPRWFGPDGLHLNEQGYRYWTEMVRPVVTGLHAKAAR